MAYLGKTFKLEKNEKFDEFLTSLGVSKDRIDVILADRGTLKVTKDGDTYTETSVQTYNTQKQPDNSSISFKSGVEFVGNLNGREVKNIYVVDGNTITHTQTFPNGSSMINKKEFSADKLVVTATNSVWDGVAHRYYSAA